jgi:Rps23 Pro-64 3,4-dihydroxylase Tpa1-like proline 4-hydroxylase
MKLTVAFVYHLSKDWLPGYGGLFMRMDWDWKTVNKTLSPPFNTLAIFDTSGGDQGGSPHLVSEIAQGCNNKRISYTGWYE